MVCLVCRKTLRGFHVQSVFGKQMKQEIVTVARKAADQMAWAHRMNSIRNRAEEIVLQELICSD
jgi:hypothetical protein